jgi:hypothetical protein
MSSEKLGHNNNVLKGDLGGGFNILTGSTGEQTDLGIARRFGGASAAYSLRDIGAMNGRVVKVRRIQDDAVEDFSALQVASGSIEKFAIGQDVLDLYNNAAYFPTDSDYFSLGSGITLSGAFTISFDVVFTGSFGTNTSRIFQDDAGIDLLTFTTSNVCKFRVGTVVRSMSTLSTALQLGRKYSMIFARDGSGNYTLTIDGVQVSSRSSSDTDDFLIQRMGFKNRGSISNININSGQHIYAGDGAENSNWLDTGSGTTTNATKVGTPVAFTGQGIDAFVDTWYDQSGNSRPLIQATMTEQPLIIEDGSLLDGVKANVATSNSTMQNLQVSTDGTTPNFGTDDWANGGTKLGLMYVGSIPDTAATSSTCVIWGGGRGVASFQSGGLSLQIIKGGNDSWRLTNERQGLTPSAMTTSVTLNTDEDVICYGIADNRDFTVKANNSTNSETESADLDTREDTPISLFGSYQGSGAAYYQRSTAGTCKECYLFSGDNITEVDAIATEINKHYNIY